MTDLFQPSKSQKRESANAYTAHDIEVLEGLEPVRRRPGMYIGGTDENAMHHLISEIFDNAMDEAVAGHASRIDVLVEEGNYITISDNGRGIPIDPHPKFPKQSALEIILTTLHAGGKFGGKAYDTSGGLHGVGLSVVNALADELDVAVVRDGKVWRQLYSKGAPQGKIKPVGEAKGARGTRIRFHPDPEIFGARTRFRPEKIYNFIKAKAYLYRGVEIAWECAESLLPENGSIPATDTIHFEKGLQDYLEQQTQGKELAAPQFFCGEATLSDNKGRIEWAMAWTVEYDGEITTYCNTIPTPQGGTHETGMRSALTKGIKAFGERAGNKKTAQITGDDVVAGTVAALSLFYRDPQFQGQTKDKLVSSDAARLVENALRDHFDHWLARDAETANKLLAAIIERSDERIRRKNEKEVSRKAVTQKLRLPGKLADCARSSRQGTELFIVEGDSAGGSAKQARDRETQAVLPLRGKILNVASASIDKIKANQELADLVLALGCGSGKHFDPEALRYDKIVIMTDADVDGAHIASLLMTFFYQEMPELIYRGHLYLAQPPLYRVTHGTTTHYARDDLDKERLVKELQKKPGRLEIGRFKGLGEMTPPQLKETTMQPAKRTLLRIMVEESESGKVAERVDQLMGRKPEYRFQFIQEQTASMGSEILEQLDI